MAKNYRSKSTEKEGNITTTENVEGVNTTEKGVLTQDLEFEVSLDTEKIQNKGDTQMAEKELAPDFDKEQFTIEREVETKEGYIVKVRDYKKEFRKKGSIARGQLRTAEAFNVPIEHLKDVSNKLNYRKVDNIFINDLLGRHGWYDGKVMSRADLAKQLKLPVSAIEIAAQKLKEIVKHTNFVGAYAEYLNLLKAEADKAAKDEIAGGSL